MRVALVSCVKSKHSSASPAKDLYVSTLFRRLRRYAEATAERWYILSAEHGVLDPNDIIEPYERTLNNMSRAERLAWAVRVQNTLNELLPPSAEVIILAGERYRENLVPFLRQRGHRITIPLEGLAFGQQLQRLGEILESHSELDATRHSEPSAQHEGSTAMTFLHSTGLGDLSSRTAVLQAIAEFDHLGRDAFLSKYGFGPARRYFLEFNSCHYDSKAIVGAAYGYQYPERGPLRSTDFSGGESTVQRKLEDLGFTLAVLPAAPDGVTRR